MNRTISQFGAAASVFVIVWCVAYFAALPMLDALRHMITGLEPMADAVRALVSGLLGMVAIVWLAR